MEMVIRERIQYYKWYLLGWAIGSLYYALTPFVYAVWLKKVPNFGIVMVISIAYFFSLGIVFGRYAPYNEGKMKSFEEFAIGTYLGVVGTTFLISKVLELLSGVYQGALIYLGCRIGAKLRTQ